MNFKALRAFRLIVSQGSLAAAAEAMNLSQPAVSRLISLLEAETGLRLFDRSRRSLIVSAAGEQFHRETRHILDGIEELPHIAANIRTGTDNPLRLVTGPRVGAALAVIETSDRGLRLAAESEQIGQAFRWLNPVGVADFDGDGRNEIAAVITPHLGGPLKLYEWKEERLEQDHEAPGFSNHAIGSREQGLSAIADMDGDGVVDLIVPDAARRNLRVVTFSMGGFRELAEVVNAAPIDLAVLAQDLDGDGRPEAIIAPGGRLKVVKFLP